MTGIDAIAAERRRQIEVEGFTKEQDDRHVRGELGAAAACYAIPSRHRETCVTTFWPVTWARSWWKPAGAHDDLVSRRRDLVKAGALIAAEIDRLDRLLARKSARGAANP